MYQAYLKKGGLFFTLVVLITLSSVLVSSAAPLSGLANGQLQAQETQVDPYPNASASPPAAPVTQTYRELRQELGANSNSEGRAPGGDPITQANAQAAQREQVMRMQAVAQVRQEAKRHQTRQAQLQEYTRGSVWSGSPAALNRRPASGSPPPVPPTGQQPDSSEAVIQVDPYQITLQTIHRNNYWGAHSSTFNFTNDGGSPGTYTLEFAWPNGEIAANEGPIQLGPGQTYNYIVENSPVLPGIFAGQVVIYGDQPLSGQITSPDYGMISGRVFDTDGATPVAGIYINTRNWPGNSIDTGGMPTLSDGRYYIGGLGDGSYLAAASAGYPWAKLWHNNKPSGQAADEIAISGGADQTGINFILQPGGKIEGTVYAGDGVTPLANVNIDLDQGDYGTCSDSNGDYSIQGVPFGAHKVVAGRDWNWCQNGNSIYLPEYYNNVHTANQATPVSVSPGQDTASGIDFTMETGGSIHGRVTAAASGAPLANLTIDARFFDDGSNYRNAITDSDGYYTISGLLDGDYLVIAGDYNLDGVMWAKEFYPESDTLADAGRVTVSGAAQVNNINFTLDPGGSIAGRITDSQTGLPLANMNVDLEQGYWGTCTDANGYYLMPGVHFGDQYVVASRDWNWCRNEPAQYLREYYNGVNFLDQATPVPVSPGAPDVTGIDLALDIGGTISGLVTDEGGTPLANIRVGANSYDSGDWWREAWTQADGTYTISGLLDEDYRVEVQDFDGSAPHYIPEFYNDTIFWNQAQRVTVSGSGDITGINFDLAEGGVIQGHVYDQVSGAPIAGVCLSAEGVNYGQGTCTVGGGFFAFYGLPFGEYNVAAGGDRQWQAPNDYAQEYYQEVIFSWEATPVSISPGAPITSNIDFTLLHGAYIQGHVQNEAGASVANIQMVAQAQQPWCEDCTEWMASSNTDANGDYTLGPLPGIQAAVYACVNCNENNLLYYNEYYNDALTFTTADKLTLNPPNTLSGINFTLNQGWVIKGDISVPNGYSKEGIDIDIWRNDGPWYNTWTSTDAAGHYQASVPPLSDPNWALRAIPRGTDLGGGRVERADFGKQNNWDFDLLPGGSISGRVFSNGAPASWVNNVNAWSVWFGEGTQSDSDGYFTINNLPAGNYELNVDSWPDYGWQPYHGYPWGDYQRITLETGQSKGGFEFEIEPAGRLEGHVYEADGTTPVENAWVVAIQDTNYWMAWSDASGYYNLDLPAGEHVLYFARDDYQIYNPIYYPGVEKFSNATPVTVPLQSSGSLVIDQNLERRATLSGQITDSANGKGMGGVLVATLNIDPAVDLELYNSTCTDGNGNYYLDTLTAGLTRVYLDGTCGDPFVPKTTHQITLQAGVDHTLNLSVTTQPPAPRRFTIWTYNSMDYTPLTYGGNTYDPNTAEILPILFAPVVTMDDQSQWYSDLLAQVPTIENGGAQVVNNQLEVTYQFKPGLLWSDGQPLTASDLRFSWQFLLRPNPFTDQGWQSVMPLFEIESIDLLNPLTAMVRYREGIFMPNYPLAITYLLPEHVLSGADKIDTTVVSSYAHKPVGNGPYLVEDWVPGSHLDLRANPNYVRRAEGLPKIEYIRIQFTGDPYDLAQRGLIDVISDGDPRFDLSGTGMSLYQEPTNGFFAMFINNELPFFQEPAVRRALYQALDRQSFINLYSGTGWKLTDNYLSPDHPMFSSNITSYSYNLVAAAAALDAAGWVDHDADGIRDKNGVKLAFDIGYRDISTWRQELAANFHDNLATIGVQTNLLSLDWDDFREKALRGDLGAYPQGWIYDSPYDPMLYNMFHSRSIPGPYNGYYTTWLNARWSDLTDDNLLAAARTELNRSTLESLYDQQQAWMTDQAAIYPVFNTTRNMIARSTLTGIKRSGMLPTAWNVQDWYLPPNPYDLAVHKTLSLDSPAPQPGATIEYSLQVNNLGYFGVTAAVLYDTLPANLTYISATPAPSAINGKLLQWNLGDLAANQSSPTILLHAQVAANVVHGEQIHNNAQVWMEETDAHPENNGVAHTLTVREDVDLAIDKYGVGQAAVGEQYSYFLNVANLGGAPATTVAITDTLPAEVTYLSANPPPDQVNGSTLTWNLASLTGGQYSDQIRIRTAIDATGTVTNQAVIDSPDPDVNPANNHDSASQMVAAILSPAILRPTGGVTDGSPLVSGSAPGNATVRIYDMAGGNHPQKMEDLVPSATPLLLATTLADAGGHFQVALNLAEGGYILAATAEKSGLSSDYSNQAVINVDHDLPLDPDDIRIEADNVDLSMGCVQAERRMLPYQQLEISAVIDCAAQPDAHIKVIENGTFTYTSAPVSITDLGGGAWQLDFHTYLGAAHHNYQVFLEWDCQGIDYSVLLLYILVDPDGFLYNQAMVDAGVPMADALVTTGVITAYVKISDQWQIWPASLYNQFNPQKSDATTPDGVLIPGYYSFLTPSGQYRIEASAPGYLPYQSPALTVITTPVHLDIGLVPLTLGSEFPLTPADLSSSNLQADKESVGASDILTYDLYLTNSGQLASDPLTMSDPIPPGTNYIPNSLTVQGGGTASYNSAQKKITWQGSLPAGGTAHIRFRVHIAVPPGSQSGIVNIAALSGSPANMLSAPELKVLTPVLRRDNFLPIVSK